MSFEDRFKKAQFLLNAKVEIYGKPHSASKDKPEVGVCVGVVKTHGEGMVDIILKDGCRYGLRLDKVDDTGCSGLTMSLMPFVRTIKVIRSAPR